MKQNRVTREEMNREIQAVLTDLTEMAVRIKSTADALRQATSNDINFYTLEQCKSLLDEIWDIDVQGDMKRLLNTLIFVPLVLARAKTRMDDFKIVMKGPKHREVSDQAAERRYSSALRASIGSSG